MNFKFIYYQNQQPLFHFSDAIDKLE